MSRCAMNQSSGSSLNLVRISDRLSEIELNIQFRSNSEIEDNNRTVFADTALFRKKLNHHGRKFVEINSGIENGCE